MAFPEGSNHMLDHYTKIFDLHREFGPKNMPDILRFTNLLIPGSKIISYTHPPDYLGRDLHPALPREIPHPSLAGKWYVSNNDAAQKEGKTLNQRGIASVIPLFNPEKSIGIIVTTERYYDYIDGDDIKTEPIERFSSINKDSAPTIGGVLVDFIQHSEGFGLIPPEDVQGIADELRKHSGVFDGLIRSWVSWRSIPQ